MEKFKTVTSGEYELIKQDVVRVLRNTAIWSAPYLVSFFALVQSGVPIKQALMVFLGSVGTALMDLYKKWAGEAKYEVKK